jgi:hypothetical protein
VRSLFFQSSCKAILKLVAVISKMRRMNKVTEFTAVKFIERAPDNPFGIQISYLVYLLCLSCLAVQWIGPGLILYNSLISTAPTCGTRNFAEPV